MSNNLTYSDLRQLHANGGKLVVEFLPPIVDCESYAEAGMRAEIVAVAPRDEDDVQRITFSFENFEDFNKPFESANYFDKKQAPVLTAREAGYYNPVEVYYFMASETIKAFKFVDDKSLALLNKYKASAESASMSYVAWLEKQIQA